MEIVWDLIRDQGINETQIMLLQHSFLLLLMLPIVSTITGFGRHIIGLKSVSIHLPIVITFALYEISIENQAGNTPAVLEGLKIGLVLYFLVFFSTAILYYYILKKFRMHYIPKSSLIITAVTLTVVIFLIIGTYLGKTALTAINFFTLVMITSLSERFMSLFSKKKFKYCLIASIETLLLSVVSFLIISWSYFQEKLLLYPWIILITILLNIYIGRFVGLRLTEYWRFRSILLKEETPEDDKQDSK